MGKGIAVVALIAYTAIQIGIYGYIGWAIDDTVSHYGGPVIPWPVYSFAVLAIVAVLGYRHIELSAKVLGVALALEIGIVVRARRGDGRQPRPGRSELASFDPTCSPAAPSASRCCSRSPDSSDSRPPRCSATRRAIRERTIPRATYAAVILIGAFYAITVWAFVVAIGPDQVGRRRAANPRR